MKHLLFALGLAGFTTAAFCAEAAERAVSPQWTLPVTEVLGPMPFNAGQLTKMTKAGVLLCAGTEKEAVLALTDSGTGKIKWRTKLPAPPGGRISVQATMETPEGRLVAGAFATRDTGKGPQTTIDVLLLDPANGKILKTVSFPDGNTNPKLAVMWTMKMAYLNGAPVVGTNFQLAELKADFSVVARAKPAGRFGTFAGIYHGYGCWMCPEAERKMQLYCAKPGEVPRAVKVGEAGYDRMWVLDGPAGRLLVHFHNGASMKDRPEFAGQLCLFDAAANRLVWVRPEICVGRSWLLKDGSIAAVPADRDGCWVILDAATGKEKAQVSSEGQLDEVVPGGRGLVKGAKGTWLKVADVLTGKVMTEFRSSGGGNPVWGTVLEDDRVLFHEEGRDFLRLQLYDPGTGRLLPVCRMATTLPDTKVVSVALDDAAFLAVLSSRVHVTWATRAGGRLGVGNDLS